MIDGLFKPGTRWTFTERAGTVSTPKGEFVQRFGPRAFDNVVGQVVPMTYEGSPFAHGRLISAKVHGDGSAVDLTFEMVAES